MVDRARFLVTARRLDGVTRACAVHQNALLADGGARLGETGIDAGFVRHVHIAEHAAQFLGNGFAFFLVEVENSDFHTVFGERAGGCFTKARGTAGDHGADSGIEFHLLLPVLPRLGPESSGTRRRLSFMSALAGMRFSRFSKRLASFSAPKARI